MLGISDAWSTINFSHRTCNPVYYIVNWRILDNFDCPDCMHEHKHGKADENGFCSNQSTRSLVLKKTLANKTDIFFWDPTLTFLNDLYSPYSKINLQ